MCRHGPGGAMCTCHPGYQLQADGRSCHVSMGNRLVLKFARCEHRLYVVKRLNKETADEWLTMVW